MKLLLLCYSDSAVIWLFFSLSILLTKFVSAFDCLTFDAFSLSKYTEFFIERGVLGLNKELNHVVLEYHGDPIQPMSKSKFDSSQSLIVPVMPPTLNGVCRLLSIYYVLKVRLIINYLIFD